MLESTGARGIGEKQLLSRCHCCLARTHPGAGGEGPAPPIARAQNENAKQPGFPSGRRVRMDSRPKAFMYRNGVGGALSRDLSLFGGV